MWKRSQRILSRKGRIKSFIRIKRVERQLDAKASRRMLGGGGGKEGGETLLQKGGGKGRGFVLHKHE